MFFGGLCWGAALGLFRAPFETAVSFALAMVSIVTAICIARDGIGALPRHKLILSKSCAVGIGLAIGSGLAG
jgi:hypothetical protein